MKTEHATNESPYLEHHTSYESELPNGWKLCVEFVEKDEENEIYDTKADPYITESQMKEVHDTIKDTFELFGMPVIGDNIQVWEFAIDKVVERTFNAKEKLVTLSLYS